MLRLVLLPVQLTERIRAAATQLLFEWQCDRDGIISLSFEFVI